MKGFIAFLAVSAAVHTGVLIGLPEQGAREGQGSEGADILSLAPAVAGDAALIEAWEAPPEVATQPQAMPQPSTTPDLPQISPETAVQRLSEPAQTQSGSDAAPQIDTSPVPAPADLDSEIAEIAMLALPSLADGMAQPGDADPAPDRTPPPGLSAPAIDTAQPRPQTAPHFEGSTDLATATSPRPRTRPEGLAPEPAPAPAPSHQPPASAPAPARVASGAGGGATQGAAAAPTPQPSGSPAQIQSAMATWGGQIQARIARARPDVRAAGRAVVQLSVAPSGQLVGLGLAQSSGNPSIDQAALDAVRRAGRFPQAPAALTDASYSFSVPLTFQ